MNSLSSLPSNYARSTRRNTLNQGSSLLLQRATQACYRMSSLETLFSGIRHTFVQGNKAVRIQSLATDSRRVVPGALFFALPGIRSAGLDYVEEAVQRGAVAVVADSRVWVPPTTPLILVNDVRAALAKVASRFYGDPSSKLSNEAICGTSGKTVVSTLYRSFLGDLSKVTGSLGTISYHLGTRTLPAYRTTPEPIELHAMLNQMADNSCEKAIYEVSSHGIHQGRVEGIGFRKAAFLNLSREHLDYHGSLENYTEVVCSFFKRNRETLEEVVLNGDDRVSVEIEKLLKKQTKIVKFGFGEDCDFRASNIEYTATDTRFDLISPEGEVRVVSPLLGSFNVENALAAIALAHGEGIAVNDIVSRLFEFKGVSGRMELVETGQAFSVVVDYMHTEASYGRGLDMLRTITPGRLITVFGCGGDRDPAFRPRITSVVQRLSDFAVATADNPRSELIGAIFEDMKKGQSADKQNLIYVSDRKQAIQTALKFAKPGDTVLIAGKGHETFQEYNDCVVPFDDRSIARELLKDIQEGS